MFTFLLVLQALIAVCLVGVILMQQSEGGGLGMGGSPSGLMSARGAANFLTRATGILAIAFVSLSIALAVLAARSAAPSTIDTSLARKPVPAAPAPAPVVPLSGDPAAQPAAPATSAAPKAAAPAPVVPLAAPTPSASQPAERPAAPAALPTRTTPPIASNSPTPAPAPGAENAN